VNSVSYIVLNLLVLLLSQWLVTRGHWLGFLVWCAANLYDAMICRRTGIPKTSCLFGAYFFVNLCSLWSWCSKGAQQEGVLQLEVQQMDV
jgi:hypothetical protein